MQDASRSGQSQMRLILVVGTITAIAPFSVDTYLPAMPAMAVSLSTSAAALQMTISAYLLGMALFPLVLAPISDTVGRKPVLFWALAAHVVFSAGCALAWNVEALIAMRLLQAAAGGAALTAARAVLADLFRGDALSRAMSYMMLVLSIAPVVAPLVGAWVLGIAGWRWIFWLLSAFAAMALLSSRLLPETLHPEAKRPYRPGVIIGGYWEIARSRVAMHYLVITFFSAFFFFAMLTSSPFIFIDHFGMSAAGFSYLFASISAAAFAGNYLNARVVMMRGYRRMLFDSAIFVFLLALVMVAVALTGFGGAWGAYAVMVWLMAAYHVFSSNATAGLMDAMGHQAGAASAVMALFRFSGGAAGAAAVSAWDSPHPWTFAATLGLAATVILILVLVARKAVKPVLAKPDSA